MSRNESQRSLQTTLATSRSDGSGSLARPEDTEEGGRGEWRRGEGGSHRPAEQGGEGEEAAVG